MSPYSNATSRDSRSSLETTSLHLAARAAARAAASCGRRPSAYDRQPFGFGKAGHGRALCFDAEAGAAPLLGGETVVGDSGFHTNRICCRSRPELGERQKARLVGRHAVFHAPQMGKPRIMRYELTNLEWAAIKPIHPPGGVDLNREELTTDVRVGTR
jgi:hypothetical protein